MSRLLFIVALVGTVAIVTGMALTVCLSSPDALEKSFLRSVDLEIVAGRYERAESVLVERFPLAADRSGDVWLRLGISRSMRDDFAGASEMFEAGLRAAPDEPKLLYNQALLRDRMGDAEGAETALLKLKEAAPWFPEVYYHLGRLAEDRGDLEAADALYVKELNLNPASHSTWKRRMMLDRGLIGSSPSLSQEAAKP